MKKLNVTTDMIIGIGLCIALIIALINGNSTEVCIGIASNLGGYMGRSLLSEHNTEHSSIPPQTPTSQFEVLEKR